MSTLVGRTRELSWLRERVTTSADGRPQTVLLDGPVGIGKSALLRAFVNTLDPGQALTASGDEDERFLPFGVLQQLTGGALDTWQDPFAAGVDLLQLLDRRAVGPPTVFVVDDAHLADSASLTALTFAVRRLHADRVLVVVASLADDVERIPAGLLRLVEGQDNRLSLTGLDDRDVARLGESHGRGSMSPRAAARLLGCASTPAETRCTSTPSSTSSRAAASPPYPSTSPRLRRSPKSC